MVPALLAPREVPSYACRTQRWSASMIFWAHPHPGQCSAGGRDVYQPYEAVGHKSHVDLSMEEERVLVYILWFPIQSQ